MYGPFLFVLALTLRFRPLRPEDLTELGALLERYEAAAQA